jgi:hypothetical protein
VSSFKWFCLVLRVAGTWNVLLALEHFTTCFNVMRGFYLPSYTHPFAFFLQGLVCGVSGLLLIRFAPFFALFAFPTKPSTTTVQDQQEATDG